MIAMHLVFPVYVHTSVTPTPVTSGRGNTPEAVW